MMSQWIVTLIAAGCSGDALQAEPTEISWGEVDFHEADPTECDGDEGGCSPQEVRLVNTTSKDLTVTVPRGFDGETICFVGHPQGPSVELGIVPADAFLVMTVSVCGYPAGQVDQLVSGDIRVVTDGGDEVLVPWSYTPIRDIGLVDTGI